MILLSLKGFHTLPVHISYIEKESGVRFDYASISTETCNPLALLINSGIWKVIGLWKVCQIQTEDILSLVL